MGKHTKGVEEQVHVLALVIRELHGLELVVNQSSGSEVGGGLPDPDLGVECGHCVRRTERCCLDVNRTQTTQRRKPEGDWVVLIAVRTG